MFGPAGGLFSLVSTVAGIGFQMAGQQQAMKASEAESAASATMATDRAQIQAQQYTLYNTMQRRMQTQALRKEQSAQSASFGTIQAQGGNQYGSAYGGARGQISGETSTAISGISEGMDASANMFRLNQQIDQQQVLMAQYGQQAATAQGTMNMGKDIAAIGGAVGGFVGGPNSAGAFSLGSIGNMFQPGGIFSGSPMTNYPSASMNAFGS